MSAHLSYPVIALASLTFSDWMLKGADGSVPESLRAMTQALQKEDSALGRQAHKVAVLLEEASVEELDRSWTQAFGLGEGSVTPHESVALTGLVMQDPRDEVLAVMYAHDLAPDASLHEPADHLGVMLAFWARLVGDEQYLQDAESFCRDHLSWLPWLEKELRAKQPDNAIAIELTVLLEELVGEFLNR